ncbi:MAG: LacI family DNA-binding transcriptional regulator [Phycisphaerae bacterium]|nr:LacI family DNA-binding transcriptional regulator [Phycisphaerae bacterium]
MATVAKELSRQLREKLRRSNLKHGDRFMSRKDISEKFNVSPATVTNALKILSEENLVKTISGKGIFVVDPSLPLDADGAPRKTASRTLGLIGKYVPTRGAIEASGLGMVASEPIINGIWSAAIQKQCNLVLLPNARDHIDIDQLHEMNIGGVIVLGGYPACELIKLRYAGIPAISANCLMGFSPLNFIDYDNRGVFKQVVDLAVSKGHRRIGFMAHAGTVAHFYEWLELYFIQAHLNHHLMYDWREYWQIGDLDVHTTPSQRTYRDIAVKTARALLDLSEPPSLIFCHQPTLLPGLCEELQNRNLRVPDDVSIVTAYNYSEHAMFSGFDIPHVQLGGMLVENLLATITNPRFYVQDLLPLPFADRGSVKEL